LPDVLDATAIPSVVPSAKSLPDAAPKKPPSRFASLMKDAGGLALVVGTAVGVAYGAEKYITTSPRFALAEVSIDGNHFRSQSEVLSRAGIKLGDNVFSIDLDAAQTKLENDPWIAEANLARRLPDGILLSVHERQAAALVALGTDTYLSTSSGELFKKMEPGDPSELPVITGIDPDIATTDREGVARSIMRALDLAADYEHGSLGQKQPLEEIHLSASGGVTLIVGKGATQLVLGGPPYRRKLEEAARVVLEIERRGNKADAIYLDNDARPNRVVARVK
jgi:cell division protein FtsQ